MKTTQRFPSGAVIRQEATSSVFLVLDFKENRDSFEYYLCKIYDPKSLEQYTPLTFHFIDSVRDFDRFTVLNGHPAINDAGAPVFELDCFDEDEQSVYADNPDFMLRLLTSCRHYRSKRRHYVLQSVDRVRKTAFLKRKATLFERFFFKRKSVVLELDWQEVLADFEIAFIGAFNEERFLNQINNHCYFCKCGPANV